METAVAPTLDEVNRQARVYPAYALPEGGRALGLFSAGFHGWNDVIHFYRANMTATCVDTNKDKLWEMAQIYPEGWSFRVDDAWQFAEHHVANGIMYDVVSVDPFLGDAADRAADTLYLWCSLARHLVTLTVSARTQLNAPDGWNVSYMPRSSTAAWMVLQHA